MKKGWLVVNSFIKTEKFEELYAFFARAAQKLGVLLSVKKGSELFVPLDEPLPDLPDFVLFWDKDIPLAKRLEGTGVPLFNSAGAVEICDSKILTALRLSGKVAMPKTMIAPKTFEGVGYTDASFLQVAAERLGLPMVLKEDNGSFGAQVYLIKRIEEGEKLLERLKGKPFLLQQFIQNSKGRDVRINVVDGKVHSAMLRENGFDFRSNITGGGKATAYTPTAAQCETAIAACRGVGAHFAGVDILFGDGGKPIVCEVNSNPHFKSTFDCTGEDMSIAILQSVLEAIG